MLELEENKRFLNSLKTKLENINESMKIGSIKLELDNLKKQSIQENFWQDTEKGLSEIYRVLKKGGTFYNAVYSKEWLQKTSYTKKGFKLFSKEELVLLGKNTGFSDVTVKEVVNGKSYIVEYKK